MRNHPKNIRLFIAERAEEFSSLLPSSERPKLFMAISDLLDGEQSERAKLIAFNLMEAEKNQLELKKLLREPAC